MVLGLLTTVLTATLTDVSVRVEGEGYFRLIREGRAVYAKEAAFHIADGKLAAKDDVFTLPPIEVRSGSKTISIDADGTVRIGGSAVGRIVLAKFDEGSFLVPEKGYLIARDRPLLGYAGTEGFGKIVSKNRILKPTIEGSGTPSTPSITQSHNLAISQLRNTVASQDVGGNIRITIPAESTIDGARILLGDIAQIDGTDSLKALDLGNAPVHGVPMVYARERILSRLAAQGYDRKNLTLDMPATVRIRRASQTVSPEQLTEKAKASIQEKLGMEGDLTCDDSISPIEAPKGELKIDVESVSLGRGAAAVTLGIRIDGKRFLGRTLRFTGGMLEAAVDAGSSVTVRFVSSGIVIETPGRARNAGVIGQSIDVTVTNPDTRETTTHSAVVVGRGRVEVRL